MSKIQAYSRGRNLSPAGNGGPDRTDEGPLSSRTEKTIRGTLAFAQKRAGTDLWAGHYASDVDLLLRELDAVRKNLAVAGAK